mmetsp:Transcript_107061/g.228630  ORF Transcript_107061/g.228630 Transcript_107061/m.228630 type:complete len:237 (+) Transcript_107061:593-1303(+)
MLAKAPEGQCKRRFHTEHRDAQSRQVNAINVCSRDGRVLRRRIGDVHQQDGTNDIGHDPVRCYFAQGAEIELVVDTQLIAHALPKKHVIFQRRRGGVDAELPGEEGDGAHEAALHRCHVVHGNPFCTRHLRLHRLAYAQVHATDTLNRCVRLAGGIPDVALMPLRQMLRSERVPLQGSLRGIAAAGEHKCGEQAGQTEPNDKAAMPCHDQRYSMLPPEGVDPQTSPHVQPCRQLHW